MKDKWMIARSLDEIARYLELSEPNPFKSRAFERAARAVEASQKDVEELVLRGELLSLPGIGKAIAPIVSDLVRTGRSKYLDDLRAQYPPGIFELLRVTGLGLRKIGLLHSTLGISNLEDLEAAARAGKIAKLKGFGARTEQKILAGIESARKRQSLFLLPRGLEIGEALREQLATIDGVDVAEVTGTIRRRLETAARVEVAVATSDPDAVISGIRARGLLDEFEQSGDTVTGVGREETPVAVHLCAPGDFGATLLATTGSDEFVKALMAKVASEGYELRGHALYHRGRHVKATTEEALFERIDVPFVDPERREDASDLQRRKRVRLVTPMDLRGTFHIHTTFSDGRNSVAEMLAAAADRGFEYAGLSDHSQNAFYARGLTPDDLDRQHAEIAAEEQTFAPMRVFRGTEADILNDGAIDYGSKVLRRFDFVVASVHSRFRMEKDEMTERLLRALDDPFVTFLGHLTGRLLLSRDGYTFDFDKIFDRAAERGVIIEINGSPRRLELDWRLLRKAVDRGVVVSIHPDAHSIREMAYVVSGTWVARKGGLSARQIFNTRPLDEVADYLAARRKRALAAS